MGVRIIKECPDAEVRTLPVRRRAAPASGNRLTGGSMAKCAHIAAVARFYEDVWNHGRYETADDVFDSNYIRHDLRPGQAPGGPEGQKAVARLFRAAFPDVELTVGVVVADDDSVVARWTIHGTHLGDWAGVKPSGRRIEFVGVNIFRFSDGKVVELWNHRDDLGLMEQLGSRVHAGYPESLA